MSRVLLFLLPSLLPIILYICSFLYANRKSLKNGKAQTDFFSKRLYNAFLLSMVIALVCFLIFITFNLAHNQEGEYIPARIEDGRLLKGHK